jgi:hypothetical protein
MKQAQKGENYGFNVYFTVVLYAKALILRIITIL